MGELLNFLWIVASVDLSLADCYSLSITKLTYTQTLSWIGNLMGSLWFAGIFCFYGAIATADPYKAGTIGIVEKKIIDPTWGQSKSNDPSHTVGIPVSSPASSRNPQSCDPR